MIWLLISLQKTPGNCHIPAIQFSNVAPSFDLGMTQMVSESSNDQRELESSI